MILIADDDRPTVGSIALLLGQAGYEVAMAYDGERALRHVVDERPELVLLEVGAPRFGGGPVLQRLAEERPRPLILAMATSSEGLKVRSLDMGADDFLRKPFSEVELVARVRALLRRARPVSRRIGSPPLALNGLEIDPSRCRAVVNGRDLALSALELRLLVRLALDPGIAVSAHELLSEGWPALAGPDDDRLRASISRIRAKIANARGAYTIESVRSHGYRLVATLPCRSGSVKANTEPCGVGRAKTAPP